jgi:RimJ/RimL family protein N-acetyltransferase
VSGHNRTVPKVPTIETERLTLREWYEDDREPFAQLNGDARVMEHFPALITPEDSNAFVDRVSASWERGFGLWAVEVRSSKEFIGFIGLAVPSWQTPFGPAIEIGWRLSFDAWGHGYATEGARAVLAWAGENVSAPGGELVSFTTVGNVRSRRVMEKLGFVHDEASDFDHPMLPDWRDRRHVLYRFTLNSEAKE